MRIFAYTYSDPLLEAAPDIESWGWEVEKTYQDFANSSNNRLQLQQLLEDSRRDTPDYLLVRRLNELGNNITNIAANLGKLEAMGITPIALEQGYNASQKIPLSSNDSQADLLKLLNEVQSQQRSDRIRQGHARNRLDTVTPPGKVPYGYRRAKGKYSIDRSTSGIVKDFFENFLLYGSLRGAVRYLAKRYGKKISVTTGRRWLSNPVYRGDTAYCNNEIICNTHTPIISREEAAQIDRLLRRNSRLPRRTASAPRSLAGLVRCKKCQSKMTITRVTIRHKKTEYLYLRPIKCSQNPKCSAISYQEVLEATIKEVCESLMNAVAGIDFPQLDTVKKNIAASIENQHKILETIPNLLKTEILDTQTAKLRTYKIRTEISALEAKLATLPPANLNSIANLVSIPQFWLDLSESERRFYLREFIQEIEIVRDGKKWNIEVIFIF